MSHIVRNRQHIWNLLDTDNHGMDFHIHNVRNHFHRMSLKYHMDNVIRCIALAVLDIILHVMVDQPAREEKCKKNIFFFYKIQVKRTTIFH